jgi:cystathionine beta-lyase/cystathionine gamma-synthase
VVYGGTVRLLDNVLNKFGVSVSYIDAADSKNVQEAITTKTKLIFIETPANPTLKLNDIRAIANIAKNNNIPFAVDNTFLTAVLQQPLELGADIVLYSTTKYLDGHNATVGGALISNNAKYIEDFDFIRKSIGSIQSPFAAWLILQGLKTLELRIKQHSINALTIANFLKLHPKVNKVIYPGLESFDQYELACSQHLKHHGGIIAFEVTGGYAHAVKVMNSTILCTLAESLGSVETLVTHPASMTHGPIAADKRNLLGITDGLIRLSVGLEDPQDVIEDLEQALS